MKSRRLSSAAATFTTLLVLLAACDEGADDGTGGGGTGTGTGTGTGSGKVCYDVAINEVNDGSSACGPQICNAGTYCASDAGICDPGCVSELDCAQGQACDFSNGTSNGAGDLVGLCAVPGSEHEVPCQGNATCEDRCAVKAQQCMAPDGSFCQQLCGLSPSESQLDCIETTSCAALGEAYEQGMPLCGIGG
ncbi:MAG: hypothetical protein KC731_22505 [Myxococcales bacterium]|nr:hypothetical protein [Myxococcales bacterium]